MSLGLGALYRGRELPELRSVWESRLREYAPGQFRMDCRPQGEACLRLSLCPSRRGAEPILALRHLMYACLGPEREEEVELWMCRPALGDPGPLRLAGAAWGDCLDAVAAPEPRQLRLWSPIACPGSLRPRLRREAERRGLRSRSTQGWFGVVPAHERPSSPPPPPWRGNYGW